jgi:hypothetical protein
VRCSGVVLRDPADAASSLLTRRSAAQLWATSTDSLDPIRLETVFGHGPSTADNEVRKAKATVLAAGL